jgi:hypothetical protein
MLELYGVPRKATIQTNHNKYLSQLLTAFQGLLLTIPPFHVQVTFELDPGRVSSTADLGPRDTLIGR